jgi:VanZ family protein
VRVSRLRVSARWAALAAAWAGGVFWASSQPGWILLPHPFFSHDKLLHALAYALGAALVFGALGPARLGTLRAAVLAAAVAGAYGATDEWHQSYVPGRSADPLDLAADVLGAAAGAGLAAALAAARARRAARHLAGQGGAG